MFKKLFRSKTIKFNTVVPAIGGLLMALGVEIPAEVATGVLAVGNFVLRLVTREPIVDK